MVILFDARSMCYRSNWSFSALRTSDGLSSAVPHGFWTEVFVMHKKAPDAAMIFCWDGAGDSWRKKLYPGYKGKRDMDEKARKMRAEVKAAEKVMQPLLRELGFWSPCIDGVEGDDIIGLLARALAPKHEVRIFSGDKDMYQLVTDKVLVWWKDKLLGEKDVQQIMGVEPKFVTEIRAMAGDVTDNLKGLPGVGEKRALTLWASGVRPSGIMPSRFSTHWPRLVREFDMATIVTDPNSLHWNEIQRAKLTNLVDLVSASPFRRERNGSTMRAVWNQFLGQYELKELFYDRHILWEIP